MTFDIYANSSSIAEDEDMERDSMNHPPYPTDPEDTIRWADSTECYRHELHEMSHMSDDYEVIPFNET